MNNETNRNLAYVYTRIGGKVKERFVRAELAAELERRRKRKNRDRWTPDRSYIERAVEEYLRRGGRIEKVIIGPDVTDHGFYEDEFLKGEVCYA